MVVDAKLTDLLAMFDEVGIRYQRRVLGPWDGVYAHCSLEDGRIGYIGMSTDVGARTSSEMGDAAKGYGYPLATAIRRWSLSPIGFEFSGIDRPKAESVLQRVYESHSLSAASALEELRSLTITAATMERFCVRALAYCGTPAPLNSQFASAWWGMRDVDNIAWAAAQTYMREKQLDPNGIAMRKPI